MAPPDGRRMPNTACRPPWAIKKCIVKEYQGGILPVTLVGEGLVINQVLVTGHERDKHLHPVCF